MVEESRHELWQSMFATHVLGPGGADQGAAAGDAGGRAGPHRAGVQRGRGAGQPAIAPYSAAKGALERWGESMAGEIAPFGLGVTILVTGTYDTDIITDAGTTDDRDFDGPYAPLHQHHGQPRPVRDASFARPPEQVRRRAGQGAGRSRRRSAGTAVGPDASMLLVVQQIAAGRRVCTT